MILLLWFHTGVTSEEVIPDHEYWISFMVQYQKEKEYVEKILTCLTICIFNRDEKRGSYSLFSMLERVQWIFSQQVHEGIGGWVEDDGTEGGRSLTGALGQIWVNPAFTELTAYYSLAQYRDSDLIQCGWEPDRAYSDRQDEQIWNNRQNGNLDWINIKWIQCLFYFSFAVW